MGQKMSSKLPMVVILGSTGTGKTKLSLELAGKFGGEIIGADSMQVYRELDIASAKATAEELASARHHLINILEPHENCTVLEYRNRALPLIDNIYKRGKMPIIVGGTNYYIESILWKILVGEPEDNVVKDCGILLDDEHTLPSPVLHEKLKQLDPAMANRLHPNNKRKILRALEVLQQRGEKLSQIIDRQCSKSKSLSGGGLRFHNAIVFWLQCNQEILNQRLDDRVDKMIEEGLLKELLNFHKIYNEENTQKEPDYSRGIFQSIGFKEFHDYLILSDEDKEAAAGQKALQLGIERLKLVTRRYARKQNKWVTTRFLSRKDRKVPPMYGLDTTDVGVWNEKVREPAFKVLNSYISQSQCDIEPMPMRDEISVPNLLDKTFRCETCERIFVGDKQWRMHLTSNNHKKRLEGVKRKTKRVA